MTDAAPTPDTPPVAPTVDPTAAVSTESAPPEPVAPETPAPTNDALTSSADPSPAPAVTDAAAAAEPVPDLSTPSPASPATFPGEGVAVSPVPDSTVQATPPEAAVDPTAAVPPASADQTAPAPSSVDVTPPATEPVVETPTPVVDGPVQQQTFHDTREIAAAEAAGLPTPEGVPLQPAALQMLRDLDEGIKAAKDWLNYIEGVVAKVRKV